MDNKSGVVKRDDHIELPPGFRFHPTDEELIIHYLLCKVVDPSFSAIAIGEVDMNRVEPWELPWRGKLGEKEWYFFCVRDKKYPSGQRTNRATAAGYWKATGKDKEIFREKKLVGMKKTLVFYKGRAPKGQRSNWVAHEYRLDGVFSLDKLPNSSKNDCVIIRVFKKTSGGQKIHISGLMRTNSEGNRLDSSTMPQLIDTKPELEPGHVHCFSRPVTVQDNPIITCFNNPIFPAASHSVNTFPGDSFSRFPGLIPFQDSAISRTLTGNYDQNINQGFKTERDIVTVSQETDNSCVVSNLEIGKRSFEENGALPTSTSTGSLDFDCIWSY